MMVMMADEPIQRKRANKPKKQPKKPGKRPCNCVVVKRLRGVDFKDMDIHNIMAEYDVTEHQMLMQASCGEPNGYRCKKEGCMCHVDFGG